MANVKFAYGFTTPTTSTSGFDDGCIYFNVSSKKIYLRQGSSVYMFNGNDTTTNNGITNSKLILNEGTTTIKNPGAVAVDNMTSSEITINGILTGWRHSGAGNNPHLYQKNRSFTSSGATTKVKFAASFTGKGTATFTYWYIAN